MKEYSNSTALSRLLNVSDVQKILHLSRAGVYQIMHRDDFPSIRIGKRILVPEDRLRIWINTQIEQGATE